MHHALVDVLSRNGVQLRNTYQIVGGGNMDFLNLQDPGRVESKKTSKVQGFGGAELPAEHVHFGAEYVPFLGDRKIAGVVHPVSSLLMKATPRAMSEPEALAGLRALLLPR